MHTQDIWVGLDRLAFCENAILLDIKQSQQGELIKTCRAQRANALIENTGLPSHLVSNFLDDFALAAAESGGKDNVSAVFMELLNDMRTLTIHIARNEGLDELQLESLEKLLGIIMAKKSREEILLELLRRCNFRLLKHTDRFLNELKHVQCRHPKQYHIPDFDNSSESESAEDKELLGEHCKENHNSFMALCEDRLNNLRASCTDLLLNRSDLTKMMTVSQVAYEVRKSSLFRKFLGCNILMPIRREAFDFLFNNLLERIGKMARFYRAALTFFTLGEYLSQNDLNLKIQGVPATKVQIEELNGRTPLQLRARGGPRFSQTKDAALKSLIKRWASYRLHSEIQLSVYYEEHPHIQLLTNYIGCDKLSCYLCYKFLTSHGCFETGGCHQSLYSLWGLPNTVCFEDKKRAEAFQKALRELCTDLNQKVAKLKQQGSQKFKFATQNESVANISRFSLGMINFTAENMPTDLGSLSNSNSIARYENPDISKHSASQGCLESVMKIPEVIYLEATDCETTKTGENEATVEDVPTSKLQPSSQEESKFPAAPPDGAECLNRTEETPIRSINSVIMESSSVRKPSTLASGGSNDHWHDGELSEMYRDTRRRHHGRPATNHEGQGTRPRKRRTNLKQDKINVEVIGRKKSRRHRNGNQHGYRARRAHQTKSEPHVQHRRKRPNQNRSRHKFTFRSRWKSCCRIANRIFNGISGRKSQRIGHGKSYARH